MRITVFGATGRTGRYILAEGLRRDHQLAAFTRWPAALVDPSALACSPQGNRRCGRGDLHRFRRAAQGPEPRRRGVPVIAHAMSDLGVRRLVVASPYGTVAKQPRLIAPLVRRLLAAPFADAASALLDIAEDSTPAKTTINIAAA